MAAHSSSHDPTTASSTSIFFLKEATPEGFQAWDILFRAKLPSDLKDALKLPGPHLLAAAPDRARSWIADANAHFPRLRVVSLARGAADDDLRAKRAAIRQGAVDVVIVAADALVASATERASAARERARRAEDEKSRGAAAPSEEKIGAARVAKDQEEAREDEADGTPATCDGEADDAEATAAKESEQPSFPSSSDAADLATAGSDDAVAAAPAPRGGKQRPRSKKKGAVGQKKASSDKSGGTRTRPGFLPAHALETTFRCLIVDADDDGGDPRGGPPRSILPALASAAVRETIAYSRLVLVGSSVVPRRYVSRVGAGVGAPPADAYASFRAALALLLPEAFAAADRANAEEAALTARTAEAGDDFSREAFSEAAADPSAAVSVTTSPRAFWDAATFCDAFAPPKERRPPHSCRSLLYCSASSKSTSCAWRSSARGRVYHLPCCSSRIDALYVRLPRCWLVSTSHSSSPSLFRAAVSSSCSIYKRWSPWEWSRQYASSPEL